MPTVSLGTSTSRGKPIGFIKEEGKRSKVEKEKMDLMGTDDLEAMPSKPQPLLTQESLAGSYRRPF